jgi:hypothetical protein
LRRDLVNPDNDVIPNRDHMPSVRGDLVAVTNGWII